MKNVLTKIGSLMGALAFATLVASISHVYSEEQAYKPPPTLDKLLTSVVEVETPNSICTGWVVKGSTEVVTAAHCFDFDPAAQGAIVHFSDGSQAIFNMVQLNTNANDPAHDWAVLVLNTAGKAKMPDGLEVCPFKPYYGEDLVMIGAGYAAWPTMKFGKVSNPSYTLDGDDTQKFIIVDLKILPGDSGGPVIDMEHGCVMGTAEMIANHGSGVPYGVNFVTPVHKG